MDILWIDDYINGYIDSLGNGHGIIFIVMELNHNKWKKAGLGQILTKGPKC